MDRYELLILSPLDARLVKNLMGIIAGEEIAARIDYVMLKEKSPAALREAVSTAHVILGDYTFSIGLEAQTIREAKNCMLIQQPSAGYQHIDTQEAARMGIPVANVAGANAIAVAEHTVMVILCCLKKLILAHDKTKRGEWAQDEMALHGVFELCDKTVGIIGMGRIGREVALRLRPFGPRLLYHDIKRLDPSDEASLDVSFMPLDDILAESDIVTIHTPLTPDTRNMIDEKRVALMKQNAILVNVSRGEVLDEDAVASALAQGRISGGAFDVFSEEPIRGDNPLLSAPNTVLTPHIAGATNEARFRIITEALANIASVLDGGVVRNIVNGVEPRNP